MAALKLIRVGPAGWSYKDWAGIVYPAQKPTRFDPLRYLSKYFDTIEVDSTFYRPMPRSNADSWVERVQDNPNFRFTAKLWKRFTHERDSAWAAEDVKAAREVLEGLRDGRRLGAVLMQFPWSFRNNEKNQEWLRDVIKDFEDFPLVLEVRHVSWDTPEFFAQLEERGVGFVNIDQPMFHDSIAPSAHATAHVGYVRVHGRNYKDWFRENAGAEARYNFLYSAEQLRPWAKRAKELAEDDRTDEVYVVTNNHYLGQAPANALMLKSMLERERVPAPPELFEKYEKALKDFAEPVAKEGTVAGKKVSSRGRQGSLDL
jgi:uncharacterized protein YecE (DUF72 family)